MDFQTQKQYQKTSQSLFSIDTDIIQGLGFKFLRMRCEYCETSATNITQLPSPVGPSAAGRSARWGYNQLQASATKLAQAVDTRTGREFS